MPLPAALRSCGQVGAVFAVGTSMGFTLVFDIASFALTAILGTQQGVEYAAVTAVDISPDGQWIAVGCAVVPVAVPLTRAVIYAAR